MPRLVGERSNSIVLIGAIASAALTSVVMLEYFGAIDVFPNFGRENEISQTSPSEPPTSY